MLRIGVHLIDGRLEAGMTHAPKIKLIDGFKEGIGC
jgi:hypothetical protein